ncbi:MAG: hypothetical protein Q8N23_12550 [Archangium sp.]|nr:hypothetical protein [Archangium sp.]MDP3153500.1 hypothetical protein [Archangium sp.]MDP3574736.1 hypothetical protein [Archangium sp.]
MDPIEAPSQSYLIAQHVTYLVLSLGTTAWVGRTLYRNGAAFLADTFIGKEKLAESVNQLLLVGFYLVNGGWVVRALKGNLLPLNASAVIENVATNYGTVLLTLGVMHFGNLYVLNRMRRRAISDRNAAPVAPEQYFRPVGA